MTFVVKHPIYLFFHIHNSNLRRTKEKGENKQRHLWTVHPGPHISTTSTCSLKKNKNMTNLNIHWGKRKTYLWKKLLGCLWIKVVRNFTLKISFYIMLIQWLKYMGKSANHKILKLNFLYCNWQKVKSIGYFCNLHANLVQKY